MKFVTFRNAFILTMALAFASLGNAQNLPISADRYLASDYGQWQGKVLSGPNTTGAVTYVMQAGYIVAKNGRSISPFATNAPLLIGTNNQETATPSTISGCVPVGQNSIQCSVTVTVVNAHGQGELIQSGTFGLQEAINDASQTGSGVAAVNQLWTKLGGTDAILSAASFALNATFEPNAVVVEDVRGPSVSYWYGAPGLTLIATPAALTKAGGAAATLTTSTTGGSIATATTPRFAITLVDQFGGETAASDDSNANAALVDGATATNSYGVTCPTLPAGAVGCRLYVSATGGTTQTETLAAPAQITCATAAPLSPLTGTCGAGVITLTALPATTAAGPPQGTAGAATALSSAHTTVVAKRAGIPPTMLPFNDSAAPGYWPVTVTSATTLVAGFDVMGELQYPAGFFNSLGSIYRICGGGVTTPSAATVAGTWAIRIGPRENSAGTSGEHIAVPFGMVASKQWTAAASHFDFCTDVTVSTTGTSGVLEGSGTSFCVVIADGSDGAGTDTCVGAFNAASTATDLTVQGVVQVSYVQTAASWTVPQLRYLTIRRL